MPSPFKVPIGWIELSFQGEGVGEGEGDGCKSGVVRLSSKSMKSVVSLVVEGGTLVGKGVIVGRIFCMDDN